MFKLIGLLVVIAAVAYFTNPTEAVHRAAAGEVLRVQANEAANNFDLGGLIESGAAALAQQGSYESFYVGSRYVVEVGGDPIIECWGAFTQVRCNETQSSSAS